jgi:hypothetical protein
MSKPSRRPTREARKEHQQKRREAQRQLRTAQVQRGVVPPRAASISNRLCPYSTEAEERAAREDAVAGQLGVFRALLPKLLKGLSKISDPRQPKKIKHKLTVVLLYGLLSFVLQLASRREANRELSRPAFLATLQALFPELESLPHADTLHRLLQEIEVQALEETHVEVLRRWIRNKKFRRYLIAQCYPIAIDGTQKLVRCGQWLGEEWLERRRQTADGERVQPYVYGLEANLVFHNGVTLPLLSEFLNYAEGDPDDHKQDCELKAFYRLAARLKAYFPRLPILLLLDGLYPNGPLMALCHHYGWQFMIVLPAKCLPSVWSVLSKRSSRACPTTVNTSIGTGVNNSSGGSTTSRIAMKGDRKSLRVHAVGCEETWQEVDPESGELIAKQTQHVWLSSQRLDPYNVHERCNLGALNAGGSRPASWSKSARATTTNTPSRIPGTR